MSTGRMVDTPGGPRGPYRESLWAYRVLRVLMWLVSKVWFRIQIHGREHLPATGGYVLAPIHRSILDSLVMSLVTWRRVRYLGKDSLWKSRFASWFLTTLGGYPVARGTPDRAALRYCQEVVEAGEPLVMFPEGTRQEGAQVADVFDGPMYVAARAQAPIVPVGIGGSDHAMPKGSKMIYPRRIVILIGTPLVPPEPVKGRVPRAEVSRATQELAREIQGLYDDARARVGDTGP